MNRRDWIKLSLSGTAALILGTEAPALQPRKTPPKGFRTGLDAVDDYTGCWDRGYLISIYGNTGAGKTAMGCQIAKTNVNDGHNVIALVDNEDRQWALSGIKTVKMPKITNFIEWDEVLYSIQPADLIIIDAEIPFFYFEKYSGIDTLSHRIISMQVLARHCVAHNRSAVMLVKTNKKIITNNHPICNDTVSRMSNRIFSLNKSSKNDLVKLQIKNYSFFYNHVVTPYEILMKPVPTINWNSIASLPR